MVCQGCIAITDAKSGLDITTDAFDTGIGFHSGGWECYWLFSCWIDCFY